MYKEMIIKSYGYPFTIGISYELKPHGVELVDVSIRSLKPDNVNDQEYYHTMRSFEYALKKGEYDDEIENYLLTDIPVLKEKVIITNQNFVIWSIAFAMTITTIILTVKCVFA